MNTNEIIEKTLSQKIPCRTDMESSEEYQKRLSGLMEYYEWLLKVLERSQIIETKDEPCKYCEDDQLPIFEANVSRKYNPVSKLDVKFCPNCGRQLPEVSP